MRRWPPGVGTFARLSRALCTQIILKCSDHTNRFDGKKENAERNGGSVYTSFLSYRLSIALRGAAMAVRRALYMITVQFSAWRSRVDGFGYQSFQGCSDSQKAIPCVYAGLEARIRFFRNGDCFDARGGHRGHREPLAAGDSRHRYAVSL